MRKSFLFVAGVLLASLCGCQGASPAFKIGAAASGPYIQRVTDAYVTADASITPGEKADRLGKTETLRTVTTAQNADVETVAAAWADVSPMFMAYTNADARLDRRRATTGPAASVSDRQIIQGVAARLDALILRERTRIKWGAVGSPATGTP